MHSVKDAYRSFLNTSEGCRLYNLFKQILYSKRHDSLVQVLNNDVLQSLDVFGEDVVEVLDIGAGDGRRARHILGFLHDKFAARFRLDLVEQSGCFVQDFRSTEPMPYCQAQIHHALFEDIRLDGQYDLVLLIHSIFAFDDGAAIDRVCQLRKPDGWIVVVSNSPSSFLGNLKLLVDQGYDDRRYEVDRLCSDLDRRRIAYREMRFTTRWAIEVDRLVEQLDVILKWITLGHYRDFSPKLQDNIDRYIKSQMVVRCGRAFFQEQEMVVLIGPI